MMPLWWWNNPPWLCSMPLLFIEIHYSDNRPGICLNLKFPGESMLESRWPWRDRPIFLQYFCRISFVVEPGCVIHKEYDKQKKTDWIASSRPTVQKCIFRASAQNNEEVVCNKITVLWVEEIDSVSLWNAEINCDGKMGKRKPSAYKPNLHKREIFIEEEMSFNTFSPWIKQLKCAEPLYRRWE